MDFRYAVRVLRTDPAFAIPAILAVALGIGAVTAIFSIVDTMLLRPLPYRDADRLVSINTTIPGPFRGVVSPEFLEWKERNSVLESFSAMNLWPAEAAFVTPGGPVEVRATHVSDDFLATLGVAPLMGTGVRESGLVVSYALWRDRFGGDPAAIGKLVTLDAAQYRIAGVLPPDFHFPQNTTIDVLVPFSIDPAKVKSRMSMAVWDSIGRLKPGVSIEQARANFGPLYAAAKAVDPRMYRDTELLIVPYREWLTGNVRTTLWLLLGAVGFVLLIACANVANLLLARAAGRDREIAIRGALGATRGRLVRQLLTESVLLSLVGCAGGMAVAAAAVWVLRRIAPVDFPRAAELAVNPAAFVFPAALAFITGGGFGLAPALSATRNVVRFGRSGPRGVLVAAEVVLSFVLLAGAGLLFQSLWRMQHRGVGFAPQNLFTSSLSVRGARLAELRDRLGGVPGTLRVGFTNSLPPSGAIAMSSISREERPLPGPYQRGDNMLRRRVDAGYFSTLGIPLKRGRLLTAADSEEVTLVNESLARHYFAGEDPIGMKIDIIPALKPPKTIVGIVGDVKNQGLAQEAAPEMYTALRGDERSVYVVVRSLASPAMAATMLREEIRAVDPATPAAIQTMDESFAQITARPRFNSVLFGSFAGIALVLAVIGIYGGISFAVARRAREIGIRMALGAGPKRIARHFLWETMGPVAGGIVVGLAGAAGLSRSLGSLLYDIRPVDAATYGTVCAVLLGVRFAAAVVPARRAMRTDPMEVLRAE